LRISPVSPEGAIELLALVGDGTISGPIAKQVLEKMLETGDGAAAIVEREGLKQTSDTGAIEAVVDKVLADNADKVGTGAAKEALRLLRGPDDEGHAGQGQPQLVNELLKKKLG
jgi:aspartyl-tRNA(Asn)/glutamyl-tRNA(Gln) amidotransferase subunit B